MPLEINKMLPPFLEKKVQKDFKRETELNMKNMETEHGKIVTELELEERSFKTVPKTAFKSLKDCNRKFS